MSKIFVLSGPSRSGKNTIAQHLLKDKDLNLSKAITCTTRDPRAGEKDSVDYYFLTNDEFDAIIANGDFVEWANVHDYRYGTSVSELEYQKKQKKNILLVIDVKGAKSVKEKYPDAKTIFIQPSNIDDLKKRMEKSNFSEHDMGVRLRTALTEMETSDEFDYVVINKEGHLKQAINKVTNIIK